jgi:hypothetical protein
MRRLDILFIATLSFSSMGCPPARQLPAGGAEAQRRIIAAAREETVVVSCPSPASAVDRGFSMALIRRASVTLRAEQPGAALHRVSAETRKRGGYLAQARQRGGSGSLTLRVPPSRLEEALCLLAQLGPITRLSISSTDATGQLEQAASRVEQLTRILGADPSSTSSSFARWVVGQLEAARREKQRLDDQLRLATIQVTIAAR